MKTVKKAQTGVQVSKKDMKAHPEDFKFLKAKKTTVKKARSGGSYSSAGKATGHTGSGMLAPTPKNVKRTGKPATFQSGGSLGMKSVKAGVDKNPSVTRADIITAGKQNAGKAKGGKTMKGKCRGGC
jgi:hypothetical protein